MTSTRSATATALPVDLSNDDGRASFFVAIRAEGANMVHAVAPDHPDASLIRLSELVADSHARSNKIAEAIDKVGEGLVYPDFPEALYFRDADRPRICSDPYGLAVYHTGDQHRRAYEDLRNLSLSAQAFLLHGDTYHSRDFCEQHRQRANEIREAMIEHGKAVKRAEQEAGTAVLSEALDREESTRSILMRQIATTQAKTPEGVAAKGRAALLALESSLSCAEADLSKTLEDPGLRSTSWHEPATVSLLLDIARMSGARPMTEESAA